MSAKVYSFKDLPAEQAALAGGKGKVLARLYQAGYPVPEGFIILPGAFDGDDLTPESWAQVQAHLAGLRQGGSEGDGAFAVRSSALNEDSAQASFAGAFESVLDVRSDAEVWQAVRTVRGSVHSQRVQVYAARTSGAAQPEQEIAVVVQRLVRADYSGVLFTTDPLTGDLTRMTGNFVQGMGEKLVSGQVNAQAFTLSRPKVVYSGPAELARLARLLYRSACRLEKELGGPQDIEWAAAGGRLYILQARPVTTLNPYKAATAEWNDSLRGNFLWSGANLGENAPFTLTPFTCSLRKGLDYDGMDLSDGSCMGLDGFPLVGIIGGRAYMNLSVQVSALRPLFGGDSRKALNQITAWWGEVPREIDIPLIPVSAWQWWSKVLPKTLRFVSKMSRYRKEIQPFVADSPRWCSDMCQRIRQARSGEALLSLMETQIKPYSLRALVLANAGATDLPNRLESDLSKLVGAQDASALLSNLSGLSAPLESLGPLTGLVKVARGEMSREAYLQAYGHRGVNEVEYAWPRPSEDPDWLDRQLAEFARAPVDLESMFAKQQAAYTAAWERFCARFPGKVRMMKVRLEQAAQAAHTREAVRSAATRSSVAIRAFALRAGELTGLGEDIFFFTIQEVSALLLGDSLPRDLLNARKETYERYRALPPYPTLIAGRFEPFSWAASPERRSDFYDGNAAPRVIKAEGSLLKGFAGALGVVEGTVRRLERLEDSGQLLAGEILVTTMTNIGWTPLFPRLAAIVTDLGAPLSHASIVARELGIPAVVGCGDATMRLKTGDRVRVNGGQGTVEILES